MTQTCGVNKGQPEVDVAARRYMHNLKPSGGNLMSIAD